MSRLSTFHHPSSPTNPSSLGSSPPLLFPFISHPIVLLNFPLFSSPCLLTSPPLHSAFRSSSPKPFSYPLVILFSSLPQLSTSLLYPPFLPTFPLPSLPSLFPFPLFLPLPFLFPFSFSSSLPLFLFLFLFLFPFYSSRITIDFLSWVADLAGVSGVCVFVSRGRVDDGGSSGC